MARPAFEPARTRTVALSGHRSAGKTTLGDAILHAGAAVRVAGRPDAGTSLLDHDAETRRRGFTLQPSFAWIPWEDHLVQLVDLPGAEDLGAVRDRLLASVEGVVVVVDAAAGLQSGTRRALRRARELGRPVIVAVSARSRALPLDALAADVADELGRTAVVVTRPVEGPDAADCVLDVLAHRVLRHLDDRSGRLSPEPVPGRQADAAAALREPLVEAIALTDEALLTRYLEDLDLDEAAARAALGRAVAEARITPLLWVDGHTGAGVPSLLDAVVSGVPAPPVVAEEEGFSAEILASPLDDEGQRYHVLRVRSGVPPRSGSFVDARTRQPARVRKLYQLRGPRRALAASVVPGAIVATWEGVPGGPGAVIAERPDRAAEAPPPGVGAERFFVRPERWFDGEALSKAAAEAARAHGAACVEAPELGGWVVEVASALHRDLFVLDLERTGPLFEVDAAPVDHRETPSATVRGAVGEIRRTDDDEVIAFGQVVLDVSPADVGAPLVFEWGVVEDRLPRKFAAAVEAGVVEGLAAGPRAGQPVVGLAVRVVDGDYDAIFSTPEHLAEAGAAAIREALRRAGTDLLEPRLDARLVVPSEAVGPVVAQLGSHRSRVLAIRSEARDTELRVAVPSPEWPALVRKVRSLTSDLALFHAERAGYERVPPALADGVAVASLLRSRAASARVAAATPRPAAARAARHR